MKKLPLECLSIKQFKTTKANDNYLKSEKEGEDSTRKTEQYFSNFKFFNQIKSDSK